MLSQPGGNLRSSIFGSNSKTNNDFRNISSSLASMNIDDKALRLKGRIGSMTADAKKSGDKLEMAKIKVVDVMRMSVDTEESFVETMRLILTSMDMKLATRPIGYSKHIVDSVSTFIHMAFRWKPINGLDNEFGEYLKSRYDLTERLKTVAPKEAMAWADKIVGKAENMVEFQDLMTQFKSHHYLVSLIGDGAVPIVNRCAAKLSKSENIDAWDRTDFARELAAERNVRNFIMEELYRSLCSIHTAVVFRSVSLIAKYTEDHPSVEDTNISTTVREDGTEPIFARFKEWSDDAESSVLNLPAWGPFGKLVRAIHNISIVDADDIANHCEKSNSATWQAYQMLSEQRKAFESEISGVKKERKKLENDIGHLESRLKASEANVKKLTRKALPEQEVAPVPNAELRRTTQALSVAEEALAKKEAELARTKQLLNSILSGEGDRFILYEKVTLADIRKKKGVIIGGHVNVTSKLRKELPNCIFFSPDAKNVDDEVVRNADYVLFFTGYVNHCLTGSALRVARLHEIPTGYSDRVNINLVLEDVMAIFSGETAEA